MQLAQISHNPDLQKLSDEGFDLEICGGHLLVHHIPYLNSQREIKYGTIVTKLTMITPTLIGPPADHTVFFKGEAPCDVDCRQLVAIINNSLTQQLSERISINHFFSSRPKSGKYEGYYDKIRTYAEILSSQARGVDDSVTYKIKKNG